MKKIIFIISAACFSLPFLAHAAVTAPNNLDLVGYWNFNEATGTIAHDESGNKNNGTFVNSPTWTSGKLGSALSFSGGAGNGGNSSYLNIPWADSYQSTITISAWVNSAINGSAYGTQGLIVDVGTFADGGFDIRVDTSGKWAAQGVSMSSPILGSTVVANQWHLLTFTYSGCNGTLYIDGISAGTGSCNESQTYAGFGILRIGEQAKSLAQSRYFDGKIDDVRVYNRALGVAEIANLYKDGAAQFQTPSPMLTKGSSLTSGLVGLWTMDGSDTNWNTGTETDRSGNGNVGNFVNLSTTTTPVAGKIGQAFYFNGGNSAYVQVPTITSSSYTTNFTVSAWVNPATLSGPSNEYTILGTRLNNAGGWQLDVGATNTGTCSSASCIVWRTFTGSQFAITTGNSVSYVPIKKWTHVVVEQGNGTATIFVNGVQVKSAAITNPVQSGTQALSIAYIGVGSGGFSWNGSEDDVRVYNRLLTSAEVKQLYFDGAAQFQTPSPMLTKGSSLTSGLVGLWTMDGSDTNWNTDIEKDESIQGNNGSLALMSTTTSPVIGKIGQAMNFNGNKQDITVSTSGMSAAQGSLSVWFNAKSYSGSGDFDYIYNHSTSGNRIFLYVHTGQTLCIGLGGNNAIVCPSISFNKWNHAVLIWNNGTYTFYVNDIIQSSGSYSNLNSIAPTALIGGSGANSTEYFTGAIDDVRMYSRALSTSEVKQLYLLGH